MCSLGSLSEMRLIFVLRLRIIGLILNFILLLQIAIRCAKIFISRLKVMILPVVHTVGSSIVVLVMLIGLINVIVITETDSILFDGFLKLSENIVIIFWSLSCIEVYFPFDLILVSAPVCITYLHRLTRKIIVRAGWLLIGKISRKLVRFLL